MSGSDEVLCLFIGKTQTCLAKSSCFLKYDVYHFLSHKPNNVLDPANLITQLFSSSLFYMAFEQAAQQVLIVAFLYSKGTPLPSLFFTNGFLTALQCELYLLLFTSTTCSYVWTNHFALHIMQTEVVDLNSSTSACRWERSIKFCIFLHVKCSLQIPKLHISKRATLISLYNVLGCYT